MHRISRFYFVFGETDVRHPIGYLEALHTGGRASYWMPKSFIYKRLGILLDALKSYTQGVEHLVGCHVKKDYGFLCIGLL